MSAPVRVLVADDDAILREIAKATLEQAGFSVECVASGDEAVAACALRLPDIALLDVDMPAGDGFHACANIRALPGGVDVPIVMVTGLDDPKSIDDAYDVGATDFVVKPINWPLLGHRIRYVLRGARTIEDLRLSEQKNAALLKAIPDGIFLVDAAGAVDHCFSPFPGRASISPAGAVEGGPLLDIVPDDLHAQARACLATAVAGRAAAFEFSQAAAGERRQHFECRFLPQTRSRALVIVRDVTARKETEAHIHRLAYFDALTGLPNREWIGEYLNRTLGASRDRAAPAALLYVDLDQFKRINDTLGHPTGDALLQQVARRLAVALDLAAEPGVARATPAAGGVSAELARVGGDEFIVVLTGAAGQAEAERVASRILDALAAPYLQNGYELVVTPSIGIAMYPEHGADAETLLKSADGAMYEAKAAGRNQFRVCDNALSARALKRLSLEMDLRRAFDNAGLEVYYQPKYDTASLKLIGGEALLRWFHPERGQIPTGDFIAVAEETGLISEIGRWTMEQVCRDLSDWRRQALVLPSIAVNVSGRDFAHPDSLLRLAEAVNHARLSPSLFELELTEGILMRDAEVGRRALMSLKEFGFGLAVDDFGTGYCSLSYLKRFPLDTLKIDRSFVNDICTDEDDAAIVRAIIALGHSLGLRIVAEGVATEQHLEFLRHERCDAVQGFLMSPAIPAGKFAALLAGAGASPAVDLQDRLRRTG